MDGLQLAAGVVVGFLVYLWGHRNGWYARGRLEIDLVNKRRRLRACQRVLAAQERYKAALIRAANDTDEDKGLAESPCWYCRGHETRPDDEMLFSTEFDTPVHRGCLRAALAADPSDREAGIMRRELLEHVRTDDGAMG